MNELKRVLAEALENMGLSVEMAEQWKKSTPLKQNKICLKLRGISAEQGQMYLGTDWQGAECYGRQLKVALSLILLTPREQGAEGVESLGEQVVERLISGIYGIDLREILLEEAKYDSMRDCFRQEVQMNIRAMALGEMEDGGFTLSRFRLNGTVKE